MRTLFLLASMGCVYDAPLDADAEVPAPVLAGTVVVSGVQAPATTIVLIYPADNPPPPAGTGRPLTFGTVPAASFRAGSGGILEAPFQVAVPGLEGRSVLVTALMDMDEDFSPLPPFSDVLAGATCGDLAGAHVQDTASGTLAPVLIPEAARIDGVTILVTRKNTLERPSFVFQGVSPRMSRAEAAAGATQTFRVASTAVDAVLPSDDGTETTLLQVEPPGAADPCATALWVTVWDRDADGAPDPHPDFPPDSGIWDAWPRVYLQYLGALDEGGVVRPTLEPGESWSGQAALFPTPVWFGQVGLNTPAPLTQAEWVWVPAARHTLADGTEELVQDPSKLPAGAWSVTLVNIAGQTWTVPNALSGVLSGDPEAFVPASQGAALIVE